MMSQEAISVELSNKAFFYRCYRQITQQYPNVNNPLVIQVENNQIDPVDACISVLNKALFTANSNRRIANINDEEAMAVLQTFHSLHYSWFKNKLLPGLGNFTFTGDMVDTSGPALFFTRALLTPNYEFKNVFSGVENLESERVDGHPTVGPNSNRPRSDYAIMETTIPFIQTGDISGYMSYGDREFVTWRDLAQTIRQVTSIGNHWGGGVLGNFAYMAMNVIEGDSFMADGAVAVPRKWSKSVFQDFFCRELPVIRYDDGLNFVSNDNNAISFRKEGACVRCHATMDRMAGVIRNVDYTDSRSRNPRGKNTSFTYIRKFNTDLTGNETWSLSGDSDFYRKPLNGHFYYRTHDGQLINRAVSSVSSLGQVIAELDDPYICMAKRYYEYFTGIDVNISDIADPQYGRTLSSGEMTHRNEVISLGKSFKEHQNMKKLVEDILRKPVLKDSAYQIRN